MWLGLHIQMGASRWFECEEQTRFIMMRHDCLYFASGSFSNMHTQQPRVRSSRTYNCNDASGVILRFAMSHRAESISALPCLIERSYSPLCHVSSSGVNLRFAMSHRAELISALPCLIERSQSPLCHVSSSGVNNSAGISSSSRSS